MYVGNNLNVESVRDSYSSNSKGVNYSGGVSFGDGKKINNDEISSMNYLSGKSSGNYQEKQVLLTSITGNQVNIEVGGNTNIKRFINSRRRV
jgi:filamentous hemagglutinin